MTIGPLPPVQPPLVEDKPASGIAHGTVAAREPGRSAADSVSLSPAAQRIGALQAGGEDFDSAKVQAIRQAIAEGRFQVDAGAIADRLIAEATALLGPRSQ
ncbi:flagellar biosynthesis anti-sigma factor FlgM [Ramlibacter sp. AW1]|uniref:Negative regulator of flagellin synthesis n=1 Tax=Ramlibacter aurantiacus TaxID=2801330 RepID=A0A937D7H4_9BURK|nr:flagellar biosynthesis anti-sigma factor FlgM [Ramlibacter aurantiacus]MBL0423322.1 flagellar biosynthesis anti-sigma factor FlgM [Ramlibacter aurantiacus]